VFKKVIEVKKMLEEDEKLPINAACQKADISRSTYYKYKDSVFEFYENSMSRIVTFSLNLKNEPGVLSQILNIIAKYGANVLTINQNIPMNGIAIVVISIETMNMSENLEVLMDSLSTIKQVKKIEVLSRS